MRMTVEDLIDELKKCNPKSAVNFQSGFTDGGPSMKNHVARVDNIGAHVTIVIEKGV